jgi:hypothetical protein
MEGLESRGQNIAQYGRLDLVGAGHKETTDFTVIVAADGKPVAVAQPIRRNSIDVLKR